MSEDFDNNNADSPSVLSAKLKRPNYNDYPYIRMPGGFSLEALKSAIDYKPKPGDLFVVTYPKCGTTWMQYIVTVMMRKGRPVIDARDYLQNSPFLEFTGVDALEYMTDPGPIKSHLPFHLIPFSSEAKYIYVARNPKDCCVSFYHHTKSLPSYNFSDGTFDEFFEMFINGQTDYGDYFDHHLSWYEHKNEPNIHFVTYEDLKADTKNEILKIAKFLGEEHYETLTNNPDILDKVLKYSSINYMKNSLNESFKHIFLSTSKISDNIPSGVKAFNKFMAEHSWLVKNNEVEFVRKGVVGDWKNYFTPEQERRMEERIKEKTKGSPLMNIWKK
ncbi:sulfotransferase 1C2-like [Centruroides sculpturatus]|uniref:sulfotransferase 1C2-like n=1 Tax=Centruroides sculpturatus TaxID=218467 RepID=UPI000C6D95DF|nr:sulfotransferase 1C2-like [Centruroides sculpturatus]